MIHLFHRIVKNRLKGWDKVQAKKKRMSMAKKRLIIMAIIIFVAAILGRLAVRFVLNMLLGGTMWGGNFL